MPRKPTINEFLDTTLEMDDVGEGQAAFVQYCEEQAELSVDFENINRRTRRLREKQWQEFIKVMQLQKKTKKQPWHDTSDEQIIKSNEHICASIRYYFHFISDKSKPRSRSDAVVRFQTIYERRQAILTALSSKGRIQTFGLNMWEVRKAIAESIWHACRVFKLRTRKHDEPKLYLTRADLVSMIYSETERGGKYPENLDQHIIAWLFAFIIGVRPGSLAVHADGGPDECLKWNEVWLGFLEDGTLTAKVTILNYKSKDYSDQFVGPLDFTITAAPADDIALSLPHRLLALMLDRDLVDMDHVWKVLRKQMSEEEIEAAMAEHKDKSQASKNLHLFLLSDLNEVPFKKEARDQPVFLKMGPGGAPLDHIEPMMSKALTDFLRNVAMAAGLPPRVTFYAWRRWCATVINQRKGKDAAKDTLGHSSNSTVIDTNYLEKRTSIDVTMVAFCQEERDRETLISPLCLFKVPGTDSTILERLVNEHEDVKEVIAAGGDDKALKAARRRAREQVRISLRLEDIKTLKKNMTNFDLKESRAEYERVNKLLNTTFLKASQEEVENADIGVGGPAEAVDLNYGPLEDSEQALGWSMMESILDRDVISNSSGGGGGGGGSSSKGKGKGGRARGGGVAGTFICTLCATDETVTEADRKREYVAAKLHRHVHETKFHSPGETLYRKMKIEQTNSKDGKFGCPVAGCELRWKYRKNFNEHCYNPNITDDHVIALGNSGLLRPNRQGMTIRKAEDSESMMNWSEASTKSSDTEQFGLQFAELLGSMGSTKQTAMNLSTVDSAAAKNKLKGGLEEESKNSILRAKAYRRYLDLIGQEPDDDDIEGHEGEEEEEENLGGAGENEEGILTGDKDDVVVDQEEGVFIDDDDVLEEEDGMLIDVDVDDEEEGEFADEVVVVDEEEEEDESGDVDVDDEEEGELADEEVVVDEEEEVDDEEAEVDEDIVEEEDDDNADNSDKGTAVYETSGSEYMDEDE